MITLNFRYINLVSEIIAWIILFVVAACIIDLFHIVFDLLRLKKKTLNQNSNHRAYHYQQRCLHLCQGFLHQSNSTRIKRNRQTKSSRDHYQSTTEVARISQNPCNITVVHLSDFIACWLAPPLSINSFLLARHVLPPTINSRGNHQKSKPRLPTPLQFKFLTNLQ